MKPRSQHTAVCGLALALLFAVPSLAADSENLWLHVRVNESEGAKVTVNLPLKLIEAAIPMIPTEHFDHHGKIDIDGFDVEAEDMRRIWEELRSSPDMTFVTVEEADETVRIWKEEDHLLVNVVEADGGEQVDVRVPMQVMDAFFSGEGDELNLRAGLRALAEQGEGDLVSVTSNDETVRVWVDHNVEAR